MGGIASIFSGPSTPSRDPVEPPKVRPPPPVPRAADIKDRRREERLRARRRRGRSSTILTPVGASRARAQRPVLSPAAPGASETLG